MTTLPGLKIVIFQDYKIHSGVVRKDLYHLLMFYFIYFLHNLFCEYANGMDFTTWTNKRMNTYSNQECLILVTIQFLLGLVLVPPFLLFLFQIIIRFKNKERSAELLLLYFGGLGGKCEKRKIKGSKNGNPKKIREIIDTNVLREKSFNFRNNPISVGMIPDNLVSPVFIYIFVCLILIMI